MIYHQAKGLWRLHTTYHLLNCKEQRKEKSILDGLPLQMRGYMG